MFCAAGRDSVSFQKAIDLLDLTPLYEEDQEWSDGFYSEARDAVTIDGKKLAVPFMTFVPLIFRNTTVLEAAGIDWENEPLDTWEDFYDQCQRVKDAGYDATHSWSTGHFTCPAGILACDAENLTIGVENGKTTIKPEQCVRALRRFWRWSNIPTVWFMPARPLPKLLKTDQLAFLCAGLWTEPDYQRLA